MFLLGTLVCKLWKELNRDREVKAMWSGIIPLSLRPLQGTLGAE